ncbi:gamma-glutamyl-gamma-aminobutyrate hydrolase family protein [Nocardioides sp. GXZ039]|uniref:gamma-glutamyl-gamma-aminobutyrate hydrolase family protein n=1 Tax=Nocardioides sp. GXZ039 TaxID=3136018 RepID=UPI0030F3B98B
MQTGPRATVPLIGVGGVPTLATWGYWSAQPAVLVAETYLSAVHRAGALPVVLAPAPLSAGPVTEVLRALDGLLLAGGTDVGADRYGQTPGPRQEETSAVRDDFELALATAALEQDLPVLGICRGLQILNVATGGTLHQHLRDEGYSEHRPAPGRLDHVTEHGVEVEADSMLGQCGLAGLRTVNSHHHQGVSQVGTGGRVVARSVPDGAVEAVEWPAKHFVLGVQWHPEQPPLDPLFAGFVAACRDRIPSAA